VTRRELALAAAAAVLARPAAALAADDEPAILAGLIEREQAAAFAYERAGRGGLSAQEDEHARALASELAAMGIEAPAKPQRPDELDPEARRAIAGGLEAAIGLEQSLLAAYEPAIRGLEQAQVLQTAATVMASHAQHLAMLRLEAGRDPLT
jgi:Ferritin-like domain